MKIKNSFDKFDTRVLFRLFFFASLISTVLRTLQEFRYIEHETGFLTGAGWLMAILYILVFGCSGAFCLVSYLSKETASHQPQEMLNKPAGVLGVVFAVALAGDWISSFFSFITSLATDVSAPGFRGFMSSGVITYLTQSFFAFFSAIYFLIFALDLLRGTSRANKMKLLAIAPVGWAGTRLIHRFIRQISFVEVSDLLFELVMISCLVLFFMAFAQVVSGVNSTGFEWRITGFGLSAALIAVTVNFPRLAYSIVFGAQTLNEHHPFSLVDIIFAVFVASLVVALNKKTKEV